jgi:hypothetical protein
MSERTRPDSNSYPRLQAPVYFTRAGRRWWRRKRQPAGHPTGGISVFTDDEPPERGIRLHLEIFLRDGTSVVCRVEVAWILSLPDGAPARYEVGLDFTALRPNDRERLSSSLEAAQR